MCEDAKIDNLMNTESPSISLFTPDGEDKKKEVLRFCANGDVYHRGRLIIMDDEIAEGLREWLKGNNYIKQIDESVETDRSNSEG